MPRISETETIQIPPQKMPHPDPTNLHSIDAPCHDPRPKPWQELRLTHQTYLSTWRMLLTVWEMLFQSISSIFVQTEVTRRGTCLFTRGPGVEPFLRGVVTCLKRQSWHAISSLERQLASRELLTPLALGISDQQGLSPWHTIFLAAWHLLCELSNAQ